MAKPRAFPLPPPEIAEVFALLGETATLELLRLRGGTRVHIPTRERAASSWLAGALGEAALMALAASEFSGQHWRVPACRKWRALVYLHQGGRSHADIAMMVGLTEKNVQRLAYVDWLPVTSTPKGWRGKAAPDSMQLSLELDA